MVAGDDFSRNVVGTDLVEANSWNAASVAGNVAVRDALRVVVATSRQTIRSFFCAMAREAGNPVLVTCIPLSSLAVAAHADIIDAAHTAVVERMNAERRDSSAESMPEGHAAFA